MKYDVYKYGKLLNDGLNHASIYVIISKHSGYIKICGWRGCGACRSVPYQVKTQYVQISNIIDTSI